MRIPDVQARSWLLPGDTVKIGFEHATIQGRGERLWVTVTHRLERGYRGEIVNDPQLLPYTRGDGVKFAPEHVLEIYDDQD